MELKTILFWILLLAFVGPTYFFGYTKLVGQKEKTESFLRWGYPLWFMRLLGFIEILAGTCLFFAQTRTIGMVLLSVILIGAIGTHLRNKEGKEVMAPIFVGVHLLVIAVFSWWLV